MKIIIVNGSSGVGKDEFANLFKKNYQNKCYNWSTIDKVKKISKNNFGWNGDKTDEARKFLSEIKRIWTEFNNGPFIHMKKKILKHHSNLEKNHKTNIVYFIHCREPLEIKKFQNEFGDRCITLLVKRNNIEIPDNESDKNVEDFIYDYIIENDGDKKDLEEKAIKFIKKIKASN